MLLCRNSALATGLPLFSFCGYRFECCDSVSEFYWVENWSSIDFEPAPQVNAGQPNRQGQGRTNERYWMCFGARWAYCWADVDRS
jgi:hypothetical protein